MHRSLLALLALSACSAEVKPDPVPPAGTGNVISAGGQTGDTSSSSGGSSSSDSSSTSEAMSCEEPGQACGGDGVCIEVGADFECSHGRDGEACELGDQCMSTVCFEQAPSAELPGVCTGGPCEMPGTECEANGTCVMASNGDPLCSHGGIGEPCATDADCDDERCQEYAGETGSVLVCA